RLDAGELLVEALVAVGEALVIEAKKMEHRSVEFMDVDGILDDVVGEVVGLAVDLARSAPASRNPHGKAAWVVVAAVVGGGQAALRVDRAAELTSPDHERLVE